MKRIFTVLAVYVCVAASMSNGQCNDPYDANLCVYYTPEAATQFARDGQVSAFWSNWAGKDYIEMIPPGNCYPGRCNFTDADDAKVTIKAAGTNVGLYILAEINDNVWVDRASTEDWGADMIDFYFDGRSAETIFTCSDCLIGLWGSTLSYSTQQFQVWMGASALPASLRYAYYDEQLWSWQTMGVTFDNAVVLYGYQIDVIQISPTKKALEFFFPWRVYDQGSGRLLEGALAGLKFAFSGGYNDKDGGNADPDCLRWLQGDPWSADAKTVNKWGDLELVGTEWGTIGTSSISVTTPNGGENWLVGSIQTIRWSSTGSIPNVRIEYSTNGGSNWTTVVSGIANTGSYAWTMPNTPSINCRVRISDAADGIPSDQSNANFSIVELQSISVTSPNGGESWGVGTQQTIRWISTGTIPYVRIEYSTNNGSSWTNVVASAANTGTYAWLTPGPASTSSRIRISDAADGSPSDQSDAVFAVSDYPILIPVGSPTLDRRPTMRWHPLAGASAYTIQVDTTLAMTAPIITSPTSDTFYKPFVDLPADTIYWRVRGDNSMYSTPSMFVVKDTRIPTIIPYVPELTLVTRPTLLWHRIAGASAYTIQIDTQSTFAAPIVSLPVADTSYRPGVALPVHVIYWRVRSDLHPEWSEVDTFTILSDSIPFLVRYDGATVDTQRPLFKWYSVTGASSYRFELADNLAFTNSISVPTSDTLFTPAANIAVGTWYWRVSSSRNLLLFSSIDSFVIDTTTVTATPRVLAQDANNIRIRVDKEGCWLVVPQGPSYAGELTITVHDIRGRQVFSTRTISSGTKSILLSTPPLISGTYVLRVSTGASLADMKRFTVR